MTISDKRVKIVKYINELNDVELTKIYELILKMDYFIGYEANGSEIYLSKLKNEIEESNKQIEEGRYTSIEDLEKESKNWQQEFIGLLCN